MKKLLCILLIAVISLPMLTACKDEEKNEVTPMGRYVEEEIEMPEGFEDYYCSDLYYEDGRLYIEGVKDMLGKEKVYYSMGEDGVWQNENFSDKGWRSFCPDDQKLLSYDTAKNGDIYFLTRKEIKNDTDKKKEPKRESEYGSTIPEWQNYLYCYRSADNTAMDITPELTKDQYYEKIMCVPEGGFILFENNSAAYYPEGESKPSVEFPCCHYSGSTIPQGNKLIVRHAPFGKYYRYDLNTGTAEEQVVPDELTGLGDNPVILKEQNGDMYIAGPTAGIALQQKNTEIWEVLVDPKRTALFDSQFLFSNFVVTEDQEFYVAGASTPYRKNVKIYHYYYDPDAPVLTEKTLSMVSLCTSQKASSAVAAFQRKNPDITIDYTVLLPKLSGFNTQPLINDAIKKLNTEILAGKGPDLFILDNLPMDSYIEKGVLADLSDIAKPLANDERFYGNIINCYKTDKGTFGIPTGFETTFAVVSEDLGDAVNSLSGLAEYAKAHPDTPVYDPYYYSGSRAKRWLHQRIYTYYGNELYDENGIVTKEKITDYLEAVKALYNQFDNYSGVVEPYSIPVSVHEMCHMSEMNQGKLVFIDDYSDFSVAFHLEGFKIINRGQYEPQTVLGVSAASKYPDEARKFVSYFMNEKTDIMDWREVSVKRKAIEDDIKITLECNKERDFPYTIRDDLEPGIDFKWYSMTEEDAPLMLKEFENFDTPINLLGFEYEYDADAVMKILAEQGNDYLTGKQTLEVATEKIYSQISLISGE